MFHNIALELFILNDFCQNTILYDSNVQMVNHRQEKNKIQINLIHKKIFPNCSK